MPRREWLLLLAFVPLALAVPAAAAAKPTPTVTVTVTRTVTPPTPSPAVGPATTLPPHGSASPSRSGWLDRLNGRARPLAIEAVALFAVVAIGYAYVLMRPSRRRGRKVDRATPPQAGAPPAEREEKR